MECESKVSFCFFGSQRPWMSAVISLAPLLIFVGYFLGFGSFSPLIFLTFTILILSTTLLTLPYKPIKLLPKDQTEPLIPCQNLEEIQAQEEEEEEEEHQQEMIGSSTDSQDSLSRSECVDFSDDGSISDEESLIELTLPSGHVDDHNEVFPKCILEQRSLMELLAEINDIFLEEEDNLIEIDLSIGSIKCSRFEIEA